MGVTPYTLDIPSYAMPFDLGKFPSGYATSANAWLASNHWCLTLSGPTGCRKTTLASAILRNYRAKSNAEWKIGGFLSAESWVTTVRGIEPSHKSLAASWRDCPYLIVVDDFLRWQDTPHLTEQTMLILHRRHERGYKTILTTNCDIDEISRRISPATARRISEAKVFKMEAPK